MRQESTQDVTRTGDMVWIRCEKDSMWGGFDGDLQKGNLDTGVRWGGQLYIAFYRSVYAHLVLAVQLCTDQSCSDNWRK